MVWPENIEVSLDDLDIILETIVSLLTLADDSTACASNGIPCFVLKHTGYLIAPAVQYLFFSQLFNLVAGLPNGNWLL